MGKREFYCDYFKSVQKYIKVSKILDKLKINKCAYYRFVKNFDRAYDALSLENLERIYNELHEVINELACM